jgi:hypothetical protein
MHFDGNYVLFSEKAACIHIAVSMYRPGMKHGAMSKASSFVSL